MVQPKEEVVWSGIAVRMIMNTVAHPIEYAKVLIQIGYEPISPRQCRTLFGQPAFCLPNVFQYIKYIKKTDGFFGCYRGFTPKLCSYSITAIVSERASDYIKFENEVDEEIEEDDLPDDARRRRYIHTFLRDLFSRTVGIIISHPLDVITLRMMAQFVGKETKYNGFINSIIEIYKDNGIAGYYAGLIPRILAQATTLILVSSSTYFINKYIVRDREMKTYTSTTMAFLATAITYPFLVVSHCMAVNNCGLMAGLPPRMPIYNSWVDCWSHLSSTNQLKRGSSLLWRYYTGPQMSINGKLIPLGMSLGKLS